MRRVVFIYWAIPWSILGCATRLAFDRGVQGVGLGKFFVGLVGIVAGLCNDRQIVMSTGRPQNLLVQRVAFVVAAQHAGRQGHVGLVAGVIGGFGGGFGELLERAFVIAPQHVAHADVVGDYWIIGSQFQR